MTTTTGTGPGAVTDGHAGWDCPNGASLLAGITGPGRGTLPAYHGVIYVCPEHQAQAEARITAAGHQPDTDPAPPGHRRDPWPCGHITTHGDSGPQLADALTTPTPAADTAADVPEAADPWRVPPAPPVSLAETAAKYSPAQGYATIIVRPDEVVLGDVVDHTAGLMVVTEITRRNTTWSLGGYNPAQPPPRHWKIGTGPAPAAPPLIRHITFDPRIRVRRPAAAWTRLAGHTKKITSHNPVKRGMYTHVDGYDAVCSCGWVLGAPARSRYGADDAVTQHRADAITQATRTEFGLDAIEELERELGDVLPWRWDHGAQAQLRGLTTAAALARLTPWAAALGVEVEHMSSVFSGDEHFLWVDPRAEDTGPRLDIRAYPDDTPAGGGPCGS